MTAQHQIESATGVTTICQDDSVRKGHLPAIVISRASPHQFLTHQFANLTCLQLTSIPTGRHIPEIRIVVLAGKLLTRPAVTPRDNQDQLIDS
jgi:hypothetical protein